MNLVRGSVMLGKRVPFQRFLSSVMASPVSNEQQAATAVRQYCGITSRSELSTNLQAAERYRQLIRQFNRWMNEGSI